MRYLKAKVNLLWLDDSLLYVLPKFDEVPCTTLCAYSPQYLTSPLTSDENLSLIIKNSAKHLPTVLKFGRPVCYETAKTREFWTSTSGQTRDGRQWVKVQK